MNKFRVWKVLDNKYSYFSFRIGCKGDLWLGNELLTRESDNVFHDPYFPARKYIVEFFTGLTDKNGKEIFTGDLVKVDDNWDMFGLMAGETREVCFHHGSFRLKPKDNNGKGHYLEDFEYLTVVGNKHLLEGE